MNKTINLPDIIPVFPLCNFIFFPKTTGPLNIFEKRYLEMINDSMSGDRIIGMVQPKEKNKQKPTLYEIGCAGQGFNMTLRDIKIFGDIVEKKLELGLPLDNSVLKDFCKETKHLNQIFSTGIDLIYEFFKLENKIDNIYTDKIIKYFSNNKFFNTQIPKFADKGLFF